MNLKSNKNPEIPTEPMRNLNPNPQSFLNFNSQFQSFPNIRLPPLLTQSPNLCPNHETKPANQIEPNQTLTLDWDPQTMLTNLSFLEQKIRQVQELIQSIVVTQQQQQQQQQQPAGTNEIAARQQLVTADLTCIIIQLISTAGSLLPSVKNSLLYNNPALRQLIPPELNRNSDYDTLLTDPNPNLVEPVNAVTEPELPDPIQTEDPDPKESDDGGADGEYLPPGSYIVLQLEKEEILAPHTHFCVICGKGFKRDANLRMHMRGHGDEYKTPAALAKPVKESGSDPGPITRYSCPFVGCKRNKEHKKFQPLKTILCVKNHYKRSHCDKSYTCSRCHAKKFSVIADLKTHEKHCGRDKWLCSCGTTFSRKDKLFGHVALFQGHTPALAMDTRGNNDKAGSGEGYSGNFTGGLSDDGGMTGVDDVKGLVEDTRGYFSPVNFDSCNFGALDEFVARGGFELSDSPFSFMPSVFGQRNIGDC